MLMSTAVPHPLKREQKKATVNYWEYIHSLTQKIFTECPLCARDCAKHCCESTS